MKLKLIPVCASVVLAASAILANGIKGNNTGDETGNAKAEKDTSRVAKMLGTIYMRFLKNL